MNIFASHPDPRVSAMNLDDKRVIKMILESAQMLCTALYQHGGLDKTQVSTTDKGKPIYEYHFKNTNIKAYKPTHVNHPSNVWCRETRLNYGWLLAHMRSLSDEYTHRTGKTHASMYMYSHLVSGSRFIPTGSLTKIANCAARTDLGISYKHLDDVHEAYRLYLIDRWANDKLTPKWTNRKRPF